MWKNGEEIIKTLKSLDIQYELLDEDQHTFVNKSILQKYSKSEWYSYPLWDNFNSSFSVQYQYAWQWFSEILQNREVIMFFDLADDKEMIRLRDGALISEVMQNTTSMTFYITNKDTSWLYCYNDHDYLIAIGDAKTELKHFIAEKKIKALLTDYP